MWPSFFTIPASSFFAAQSSSETRIFRAFLSALTSTSSTNDRRHLNRIKITILQRTTKACVCSEHSRATAAAPYVAHRTALA